SRWLIGPGQRQRIDIARVLEDREVGVRDRVLKVEGQGHPGALAENRRAVERRLDPDDIVVLLVLPPLAPRVRAGQERVFVAVVAQVYVDVVRQAKLR